MFLLSTYEGILADVMEADNGEDEADGRSQLLNNCDTFLLCLTSTFVVYKGLPNDRLANTAISNSKLHASNCVCKQTGLLKTLSRASELQFY